MTQEPALRRKTLRPRPRPPEPQDRLAGVVPRVMLRSFAAATGLEIDISGFGTARPRHDEVPEHLPEDAFVATMALDRPDSGWGTGLICCDGAVFSGLVEVMTMGRLSERPPPPRRATATDLALLGALFDRMLLQLADALADEAPGGRSNGHHAERATAIGPAAAGGDDQPSGRQDQRQPAGSGAAFQQRGWRIRRALHDLRLLSALLDEGPHLLLRMTMTLSSGTGNRSGEILMVFPEAGPPAMPMSKTPAASIDPGLPPSSREDVDPFEKALTAQVMAAPVSLNGILGRIRLPLSGVMRLQVGDRLELPLSQLEEVEVTGIDGRPHGFARLGQTRGLRALRVIRITDQLSLVASNPDADRSLQAPEFIASGARAAER